MISITMVPIRIPQISVGRPQIDFAAVASIGYIRAVSVTDCWYRPLELLNNSTSSGPGRTTKSSVPAVVEAVDTGVGVWLGDAMATVEEVTLRKSKGKPTPDPGAWGSEGCWVATAGAGGIEGNGEESNLSNMFNAFTLAT